MDFINIFKYHIKQGYNFRWRQYNYNNLSAYNDYLTHNIAKVQLNFSLI